MAPEFGPGEYRMRGGGEAVVYDRFNGLLYGRFREDTEIWSAGSWNGSGTWMFGRTDARDLLPPEPPLVVPDEAWMAGERAYEVGIDGVSAGRLRGPHVLAAYRAAFPIIAAANGYRREEER